MLPAMRSNYGGQEMAADKGGGIYAKISLSSDFFDTNPILRRRRSAPSELLFQLHSSGPIAGSERLSLRRCTTRVILVMPLCAVPINQFSKESTEIQ
jgi:hypothetical protein